MPTGQSQNGLYLRVTYVYTLSSGESRAECRTVSVQSDGSFQLTNPATPAGATLDAIQAALVTDANSHLGGAYAPLKVTSK